MQSYHQSFLPVVIIPVVLHTAVVVEGVVVVPGVLDQSQPLTPAWRDVGAVILVEVFAHVSSQVSAGLEVGGEGSLLVPLLPAAGAAVLVIGEHVMVVNVETCTTPYRGQEVIRRLNVLSPVNIEDLEGQHMGVVT